MDLLAIAQNTVKIILLVGMPSLMISMIIGLIISIFSAVTQVNDAALSFVPKMIFVSAFILFTLAWVGEHIEAFTIELWNMILIFGK